MKSPHRRSLLWQSVCILLPLFLLAGLAVWHLFDARKVALEEARATASDLAFLLSKRLDEEFVEQRAISYAHVEVAKLDEFFYPLAPIPAGDSELHDQFLTAVDDAEQLEALIPKLGDAKTPAGLPLEPIARWRFAELSGYTDPSMKAFAHSALTTHPSTISAALLEGARFTPCEREGNRYVRQNMSAEGAGQLWALHEDLRSVLRPFFESPPTESQWIETKYGPSWLSLQDGVLCPIAPGDLGPMIARAIESETERVPDYIGAEVFVGGRKLGAAEDEEGKAQVTWDFGDGREGFIAIENVSRGPFLVASHISDTSALYGQVRTQTYWYAAVIGISTLAAVLGLLALRRSYARQLELGEMKSNFVASVSHELRAPVASVRLLAERLRSGKVADEAKRDEYYGFIEGESRRLGTLVENILDFSRIERGQKDYHFEPSDLTALVHDTLASMVHYAAERHVVMDTDINDDDETLAEADPAELRQALVNLLDNAIKFSPKDGAVTVGLDHAEGGDSIRLWVRDFGPGVPEAEREKVFERFYRSGSELTRETQGAGIGLSIVKHIAEGHSGHVTYDAPHGGGSRFAITIPTQQPNHA